MKITSQIYLVGGPSKSHMSDAAVYLVSTGGEAALIDAGTGQATDVILRNVRTSGVDPARVGHLFLTHCHFDHTGGAEAIRLAHRLNLVTPVSGAVVLETNADYKRNGLPVPGAEEVPTVPEPETWALIGIVALLSFWALRRQSGAFA